MKPQRKYAGAFGHSYHDLLSVNQFSVVYYSSVSGIPAGPTPAIYARFTEAWNALREPSFHGIDQAPDRGDDLQLEEWDGLIPDKDNEIIFAENPPCVPDHPLIVAVILHGLQADPCNEEEKKGSQKEADY
jgi:hypothetical protein